MGDTPTDSEFRGERQEKEDMLKFTFGRGNGDDPGGLGMLFVLLAAVGSIVHGVRRWLRRRRGKGFTFRSTHDAPVPLSLNTDASSEAQRFPMLTNIELRDWLITFNTLLAPELKLRTNETLIDWFERIESDGYRCLALSFDSLWCCLRSRHPNRAATTLS
ncbi:hypothetical protein [Exiguobacterium mexicanum]|uniref:hypothetical protein n=1 Tax=Exiguobacterium mexicanum TaxID=340146 RepID=UPI0037BED39C